jgi:hypothetical protein
MRGHKGETIRHNQTLKRRHCYKDSEKKMGGIGFIWLRIVTNVDLS